MTTPCPGVRYTFDSTTLNWRAPGRADLPGNPVVPTPFVDPDAVAGSVAVGMASYAVPAGALYVDPATGIDSTGRGAIGTPFATLGYAISKVTSGGTIVLRGGEYHEGRIGIDTAGYTGLTVQIPNVTIQNAPFEAAWLTGATKVTSWTAGPGYWSKAHATSLNRSPTTSFNSPDSTAVGWAFVGTQNPYANYAEQVWFDGEPLKYVNTLAEVGPGKFHVAGTLAADGYTFNATTYYIGDDPTGHSVYIGDLQTAISLLASNCTLRGVGVRYYCGSVAHAGVVKGLRDFSTFENIVVQDCTAVGLSTTGAGTSSVPIGVGQKLRNVTAIRCGLLGIHSNKANGLLHYRVRVQYNNWRLFNRAPHAGNCKVTRQRGFTAKESVYSDSFSHGLWMDEMVVGVDIITCNVQRNGCIGIVNELGGNTRIVNTLVTHNGADGIASISSTGFDMWNSSATRNGINRGQTVCGVAITVTKDIRIDADTRIPATSAATTRDSRYPIPDPDGITWELTRNTIRNCIIGLTNINGFWWIDDKRRNSGTAKSWTTMGVISDGNVYCRPNGSTDTSSAWMLSNAGSANGTPYNVFSTWKSATGLDTNSTIYDGVAAVLDNGRLDPTYQAACDAKAVPLPADIATLASADTGATHAGAWR